MATDPDPQPLDQPLDHLGLPLDQLTTADAARGRIQTARPGGTQVIQVVLVLVGLALVTWVEGRIGANSGDWDAGAPVLVEVTRHLEGERAEVTEYQSTRSWTVDRSDLARVESDALGTQIQGRLVGDCACQLMLRNIPTLPWWVTPLLILGLVSAVPGLLARYRWRHRRQILSRAPRPVTVSPVWMRRSFRPAVWGVRVDTADGQPPHYLELAKTPLGWAPRGSLLGGPDSPPVGVPATMYGPDPRNGLCILGSPTGLAVASSAPIRPSGRAPVVPWSNALSVAAGLADPPQERAVQVGGEGHSRIRVSETVDSAASTEGLGGTALRASGMRAARLATRLVLAGIGLVVGAIWLLRPGPFGALGWLFIGGRLAAMAGINFAVDRLSRSAPLGAWSDRSAARSAAAALALTRWGL